MRRLTDLLPCENCSFDPCQFRRRPYRRALDRDPELSGLAGTAAGPDAPADGTREADVCSYSVNLKALRRWAEERLSIERRADGTVLAVFRFDGTTCTNMGRPLAFDYAVTLGPRAGGYRILEQRCSPAPGDRNYTFMCEYLREGDRLMEAVARETPLLGQPLEAVLGWQRPAAVAACYCEPESRQHKWGLVLETIHYALKRRDLE